jgi:UDP-galactopyranose mutase
VPIPINRTTLNKLFDLDLKTDEERPNISPRAPSRWTRSDLRGRGVINAVGRELYELFFRGYTRKQWGLDPSSSTSR